MKGAITALVTYITLEILGVPMSYDTFVALFVGAAFCTLLATYEP